MKKKYTDEIIKILYNAQIKSLPFPQKELEAFEQKIGKPYFFEIWRDLENKGWTKTQIKIDGGKEEYYNFNVIKPYLSLEHLNYGKYLSKPAFIRFYINLRNKEINWTKWGVIIAFFTWGVGLILTALADFDKIEANYNKYFNHNKSSQNNIKQENINIESKHKEFAKS